jgi:hypothetical protein
MIVDISFLGSDTVTFSVLSFLVGLASVMVYTRAKSAFADHRYKADEAVVEAVVLEYTRRLRDYDRVLAELRADVDIMDVRSLPQVVSQPSRQPQPHVSPVSEPVAITQQAVVEKEGNGTNGTTDYILKLLSERPRSSREVQHAVGRTREHTARLMKKLHDSGLVNRDVNAKPFRYYITDGGRERLREKLAPVVV